MATLTLTNIQNAVLRLMDENGGNASFMSGSANTEMNDIIGQVTEDAVRKIHLQAPVAMLDGVSASFTSYTSSQVDWNGAKYFHLKAPSDFFRLIRCKVASWKKSISQLWWEDSVEYAKQKNRYLMGTEGNPVGFLVHHGSDLYIDLYSHKNSSSVEQFIYCATPRLLTSSITVSDRLRDACLMQIAADTLVVLGETDRAQQMQAMADRVLNTYGGMERHYSDVGNRIER